VTLPIRFALPLVVGLNATMTGGPQIVAVIKRQTHVEPYREGGVNESFESSP
jgi:hypothetical protein